MATRWLDAEEERVWRLLISVHARLMARLDHELQATQRLNLGDYEVLVFLSEAPERALRMTELAERVILSPSGLTRRVDGLVRAGLVRREACPSDKRGSYAVLTENGLARLRQAALTHVEGVRRYVVDALGSEGMARLGGVLETIDGALASQAAQDGAAPVVTGPPRSIQALVPPATDTAR